MNFEEELQAIQDNISVYDEWEFPTMPQLQTLGSIMGEAIPGRYKKKKRIAILNMIAGEHIREKFGDQRITSSKQLPLRMVGYLIQIFQSSEDDYGPSNFAKDFLRLAAERVEIQTKSKEG